MEETELPAVSVVVPVYNDPEGLRVTLQSLAAQTYPADRYEIVVVDNDSTDRTRRVAEGVAAVRPDLVRVVSETEVQSSYAARNTGIEAACGDVLAFVDADVLVGPTWLATAVEAIDDEDVEYLGCRVDVYCQDRTLVGLYDTLTGFPVERYVEEHRFAPTCCLFVSRSVVGDVGGFDERLVSGGDVEFGNRVDDSGRELGYTSDVQAFHPARKTVRSLIEKHVRVGRGIAQRDRMNGHLESPRPVYHPWTFLPPHPGRFASQFDSAWEELSPVEKGCLYGIGYLQRLSRFAGRLSELARGAPGPRSA